MVRWEQPWQEPQEPQWYQQWLQEMLEQNLLEQQGQEGLPVMGPEVEFAPDWPGPDGFANANPGLAVFDNEQGLASPEGTVHWGDDDEEGEGGGEGEGQGEGEGEGGGDEGDGNDE